MPDVKGGYIRSLIASIEIWHLNTAAAFIVVIFIYVQFRNMFTPKPHPKAIKNPSFTKEKKKELKDKEVSERGVNAKEGNVKTGAYLDNLDIFKIC